MADKPRIFEAFEWDENKRLSNINKHGIDFLRAAALLMAPHVEDQSDRNGEPRMLAICSESSRLVTIVYTMRDGICRIISARAASKNEQRTYRKIFGGRDSPENRPE